MDAETAGEEARMERVLSIFEAALAAWSLAPKQTISVVVDESKICGSKCKGVLAPTAGCQTAHTLNEQIGSNQSCRVQSHLADPRECGACKGLWP